MASDDDNEDVLEFTGTDLGNRENGIVRRKQRRYDTEEEEESSSGDSDDEDYSDGGEQYSEDEWEEELVQKALYRINKAQAKGRSDVRLSKEEIKALERRQRRMEAEERKKRKRVAIPLSQFEAMARLGGSSQRHGSGSGSGSISRQLSGSDALEEDEPSPQMGYFPPQSSARPRPKSGISTSRPSSIHEDTSKDPFQYQTAGPRAAGPKRHGSGQSDLSSMSRRGRPGSTSGWSQPGSSRRQSSDETSEELALVEETSKSAAKGREEIVVEVEPESPPGREPASSRTRSATRKKHEPAPAKRTVSSRTGTGSRASEGVRRKRRE